MAGLVTLAGDFVLDLDISPTSACLDATRIEYHLNKAFKKPTSKKAQDALFEKVNIGQYEPEAHCCTFKTNPERLHAWIKAITLVYYDGMGADKDFCVTWTNTPDRREICVEVTKCDTLMYKLFVYLTTGIIMVQGRDFAAWINKDLLYLTQLVDTIIQLNENDTNTDVKTVFDSDESSNWDEEVDISPTKYSETDQLSQQGPAGDPHVAGQSTLTSSSAISGSESSRDSARKPHAPASHSQPHDIPPPHPATPDKAQNQLLEALKALEGNLVASISNAMARPDTMQHFSDRLASLEKKIDSFPPHQDNPSSGPLLDAALKNLATRFELKLSEMEQSLQGRMENLRVTIGDQKRELQQKSQEIESLHLKLNLATDRADELQLNNKALAKAVENYSAALYDCKKQLTQKNEVISALSASVDAIERKPTGNPVSQTPGDKPHRRNPPHEEPPARASETARKNVAIIGASNVRRLDDGHMNTAEWTTEKIQASTLTDAKQKIDNNNSQIREADSVVIHMGGNDLDTMKPSDIVVAVMEQVSHIQAVNRQCDIIVSGLLPRTRHVKSVKYINAALQLECDDKNVAFYDNNKFHSKDAVDKFFGQDHIHLNETGLKIWASGMKYHIGKSIRKKWNSWIAASSLPYLRSTFVHLLTLDRPWTEGLHIIYWILSPGMFKGRTSVRSVHTMTLYVLFFTKHQLDLAHSACKQVLILERCQLTPSGS